jgi:hypothetical protein
MTKGGGAVEGIKGSEVNVPDAVFAWLLDGNGGARPLENDDIIDREHPCWLHLNYTHPDSADWLASTPLLPNNVRDALSGESLRPRVTRLGEGTLITLRCINGSTDERPDQLVAMRVYMDERLIVSTRQRKVLALDDVVNDLKEGSGPADCGAWLVDVCDALTDHASEFIEELHDKLWMPLVVIGLMVMQRAVAEDRQPQQGKGERNNQRAHHELADGAPTRNTRQEQADKRRPRHPPRPEEQERAYVKLFLSAAC